MHIVTLLRPPLHIVLSFVYLSFLYKTICINLCAKKSLKIPKGYIEDEETTQRPREKGQKDKQRSTKHTNKTEDRITLTPLKTGGELRCSERVGSPSFTSGTRRVNLVTNPVICHE